MKNLMAPKYKIGQKVIIKSVNIQRLSPKDCAIEPYAGKSGEIIDYYWINLRAGEVFYIYTVRAGDGNKEIVLHEDEIETYID